MKLGPVLLISVAFAFLALQGHSEQQPFSVTIATEKNIVKAGSEVLIRISLTNLSNRAISLSKPPGNLAQGEAEYSADVRTRGGQPVPLTEYGHKMAEKKVLVSRSRVSYTLEPGESLKDDLLLSNVYDLSHPGTYAVCVSRAVPEVLGKGTVKSNIVTITIEP